MRLAVMDRILVVVFDNKDKASQASHALQQLDRDGSIAVYDAAVVAKHPNGTTTVKKVDDSGPLGTLAGAAVGGLIGILGGPVGVAVGAVGGTLIGATSDFEYVRVASDFLTAVSNALLPGKVALVAEIDEQETEPVDALMQSLDGCILRRSLWDLERTQDEQDVATLKAEIAQSKAEHAEARVEHKAKLELRIAAFEAKLRHEIWKANARRQALRRKAEAKVQLLKTKAAQARGNIRARHEQHLATALRELHEWLATAPAAD
jgi:uncharacterized membrane protein